jgi:hypothetical protein
MYVQTSSTTERDGKSEDLLQSLSGLTRGRECVWHIPSVCGNIIIYKKQHVQQSLYANYLQPTAKHIGEDSYYTN